MAVEAIYYDGQSARAHDVTLTDTGTELIIWGADTPRLTWTASGLHAIDPPSPGQPYRLTHRDAPGARVIIRDEAFVSQLTSHAKHLKGGYSRSDLAHLFGWTLGGIAIFVLLGWFAMSVLPGPVAHLMPDSWRQRTGVQMEKAMVQGKPQCVGPAGQRAIGQLLSNLAEGVPDMPPVSVNVYDLPVVNAFTVNGGHVIVTRKLLEAAGSPEEFAGVLAHEIGHVAHLDPESQMVRLAGFEILTSALTGTNGGNLSSNGLLVAAMLQHSRAAEDAADAYARDMLVKAQIDPLGFKRFFEKLLQEEDKQKTGITALDALGNMMATHPGTRERMEKITPLPQGVTPRPALSPAEWQALKQICG